MILAPMLTSLSVKYIRLEYIQSWNRMVPLAWEATVSAMLVTSVGKAGQTLVLISGMAPPTSGTTAELFHSMDHQVVGADIFNPGAEDVQEFAEVLHVRLGGRISNRGGAAGQRGGHHRVLRGRHAALVQQQCRAAQAIRLHVENAV